MSARRAFTLVELLVVISVIAILIAMLLPGLSSARKIALRSICAGNQRQLAISYTAYGADHRDQLPQNDLRMITGVTSQLNWENWDEYWIDVNIRDQMNREYGMSRKIWDCTAMRKTEPNTDTPWNNHYFGSWDYPADVLGRQVTATGYTMWAGRTWGIFGLVLAQGLLPDETPQRVSDRKMMSAGSTPGSTQVPWFNCWVGYYSSAGNWGVTGDLEDPQVMHWRTGANVTVSDGSVTFKKYPGSRVQDYNGDPGILKFTLPMGGGSQVWLAY